ncbi:MAG: ATP-dependent 6-phosphofructokinase [Actinomycetota bacterium]|nr:ATP-dependent 6-phosphofructokinase [Actinomycetota bacterium]
MESIKTIGILTGGSDSPATNAVIRAAFVKAKIYKYKVLGIKNGWDGLVNGNVIELKRDLVSGILSSGGTILGSARINPFKIENGVEMVKDNIRKFSIDSIVCVGGDETNIIMHRLCQYNIKGVGIPQTIDNDINLNDYSIGFDSAVEIATDAIDKLHTTASSHHRIMILEVMGREAGWIALYAGIAGGADLILIPEVPFDYDYVVNVIEKRRERGKDYSIIVVAEGAKPEEKNAHIEVKPGLNSIHQTQLGGIGNVIAREIEKRTGYETRVTVLGHLQRGGRPTAFDRILATRIGIKAVDLIHEGKFDYMVCNEGNLIKAEPMEKVLSDYKPMDLDLYEISRIFH